VSEARVFKTLAVLTDFDQPGLLTQLLGFYMSGVPGAFGFGGFSSLINLGSFQLKVLRVSKGIKLRKPAMVATRLPF
jgi:hypothetical protein